MNLFAPVLPGARLLKAVAGVAVTCALLAATPTSWASPVAAATSGLAALSASALAGDRGAWRAGRLEEALAEWQRCADGCHSVRDAAAASVMAGRVQMLLARHDEARQSFVRVTDWAGTGTPVLLAAYTGLIELSLLLGRHDEAQSWIAAATPVANRLPPAHPDRLAWEGATANALRERGETASARVRYAELVATLPVDDSEEAAAVLLDAARLAVDDRRAADVATLLPRACEMYARLLAAAHPLRLSCEAVMADEIFRQGKNRESLAAHARVLEARRAVLPPVHPDIAGSLYAMALAESRLPGGLADAITHLDAAVGIYRASFGAVHPSLAQALRLAGQAQFLGGRFDAAAASLSDALAMFERAGLPAGSDVARTLHDLATVREQQQDLAEATRLARRAADLSARVAGTDSAEYARRLVRLASLYSSSGDLAGAVRALDEADAIFAALQLPPDGPERVALVEHRVRLQLVTGEHRLALASVTTLRALRERSDAWAQPHVRLTTMNLQAMAARLNGDIAVARDLWRAASSIAPSGDLAAATSRAVRINLALLQLVNEPAAAEATFSAIAADDGASSLARAVSLLGLSRSALADGDVAGAATHAGRALSLSVVAADDEQIAWALHQQARVVARQGRLDGAIVLARLAVERAQARRAALVLDRPAIARAVGERHAVLYRDLAGWLVDAGRMVEAEQVLDALRAAERRELRTRGDAGAIVPLVAPAPEQAPADAWSDTAARLVALSREQTLLFRRQRAGTADAQDQARIAAIATEVEQAQRAFDDALRRIEKIRRIEAIDTGEKAGAAAWQPLLDQAGGDVAIVQYIAASERLHVMFTTRDARVAESVAIDRVALDRLIAGLRDTLRSAGRPADVERAARALHDVLMPPPIERAIAASGATHLLLAPDGALRYVPFAALRDGQGQYLIEKFALSMMGGRTQAAAARAAVSRRDWRIVAMGLTERREGQEPLPAVADELAGIVRDGPGDDGVIEGVRRLNADFNREALVGALQRKAPALHLASHFVLQPGEPKDSYLVLGDGRLTIDDLRYKYRDANFNGIEMITLSACQTALDLGMGADGLEVGGLTDIIEEKGAQSVVATLWPVADASTAQFMREFYRRLVAEPDLPRAEALRATQRAFLAGEVRTPAAAGGSRRGAIRQGPAGALDRDDAAAGWKHPYYWAPFVLSGEWR